MSRYTTDNRKSMLTLSLFFSFFLFSFLDNTCWGGAVNIISSDYCCDPDIYPWGYHQHPLHCSEYHKYKHKNCTITNTKLCKYKFTACTAVNITFWQKLPQTVNYNSSTLGQSLVTNTSCHPPPGHNLIIFYLISCQFDKNKKTSNKPFNHLVFDFFDLDYWNDHWNI